MYHHHHHYHSQGSAEYDTRNFAEALGYFKIAASLCDESSDGQYHALTGIGLCLLQMGKDTARARTFLQYVVDNCANEDAMIGMAIILLNTKDAACSKQAYELLAVSVVVCVLSCLRKCTRWTLLTQSC